MESRRPRAPAESAVALAGRRTRTLVLAAACAAAACTSGTTLPHPGQPPPVISAFTATPATIAPGGTATLAWTVTGATAVSIAPGVGGVSGTSVAVSPAATTTYTLTATNGIAATATATVTVVIPAPVITSFTATPSTVAPSGAATLAWVVAGAASLSIDQGIGAVTGSSRSVNPAATTTYTLTATNAGGSVFASTTVTVTAAAVPTVASFTATPSSITAGGSSLLAWSVTGATSLSINQGIGTVTGTSRSVSPAATTTYTLTAANAAGSTSASATVVVTPLPPVIVSFTATPATITAGGSSVLAWSATGATSLSINQGIGTVTGTSRSVSPAATTTYTLTATNAGGSATATATVTVNPAPPVISSFMSTPGTIAPGGSATLAWVVIGATSLSIDQGIGTVTGTSRSVSPTATTTYTLTATNAGGSVAASATVTVSSGGGVAFPLQASANGRYLVDQGGVPFRINGDSAWSLIANLTATEIDTYLADRQARGFNVLLVNLLEHLFAVQAPRNRAGDYPFTAHTAGSYDFSTPNEAYFAFADAALDKAAAAGMAVLLAVMYTGNGGGNEGWWTELTNATNTRAKCYQYGLFLGNRWRNRPNIIWVFSGDFTPSAGSEGEARLLQIYQGIRDAGATQLATAHNSPVTLSSDWAAFRTNLGLNGVYPGGTPTNAYSASRTAYNRTPVIPVFLLEPGYEDEGWAEPGTPAAVRRYAWWAQLASTAGAIYGQRDIWPFQTASWNVGYPFGSQNWPLSLGRAGAVAMQHMQAVLTTVAWQDLVPSGLGGMKTLVSAGAGSGNTQVAAAATPAGTLLLAYRPSGNTGSFTIDMTAMSGTATARWWDPTSGQFTAIGTGLANTGTRVFTPTGSNAGGDADWLLVLTSP